MTGSKYLGGRDIILDVIALLGGSLFSLSLSPVGFWPLAFASPVALYAVTQEASVRRTILRFYLYNVGLFGVDALPYSLIDTNIQDTPTPKRPTLYR